MSHDGAATDRLDSWKEIAAYVGRDVRTVIRWEQKGGLPVYRVPVGQRQAVYAYKHEIDDWMAGDLPGSARLGAALELAAGRPEWNHYGGLAVDAPSTSTAGQGRRRSFSHLWPRVAIWCAAAVLLAGGVYAAIHAMSPRQIEFTRVNQITSDSLGKDELLTDGRNLYFSEERDGGVVLATVATDGGPIRIIPTPFVENQPQAISPDGQRLLVLAWDGQEWERPLWIVPIDGGKPTRVGQALSHSAAWSPDGSQIAFAYENAIYLTDDQGATPRLLHTFAKTPDVLGWSPDGRRLRFELRDMGTLNSSFWELSFAEAGDTSASSLVQMHVALAGCCDSATSVTDNGLSFAASGDSAIHAIIPTHDFRSPRFTTTQLETVITNPGSIALDEKSRRLFVIGDSESSSPSSPLPESPWAEAYLYDRESGEFRPFLPGVSAVYIDFSRDGRWITWVRTSDQTLWIGRPDGSDARQIESPAGYLQLPRWSPDHRKIAFMARLPGKTWRIYVSSLETGDLREASTGTDSQGAPTWSPDGKWLSYGNVWCEQSRTCAIHRIELSTGKEFTLPASGGLSTARWSPDGRVIAALRTDQHSIEIFNLKTERWSKLADGVTGNDLSWTADSRYLYASSPDGNQPNVIRISVPDGSEESAADLSGFKRMTGRIDTWFALTPDNSIIFLRWLDPNEIYSISYAEK